MADESKRLYHIGMADSARFFVTDGVESWQVLTFAQNKNDASIYVSSPSFAAIQWITVRQERENKILFVQSDSPGDGKLSLHGRGQSHITAFNDPTNHFLVVDGNFLKNENTLGVKHLFTVLTSKPEYLPASAARRRRNDQVIHDANFAPVVFVFWAVPAPDKLTVSVNVDFHADELETIPPESGFGSFPLYFHSVVWFAYRTKNMSRWPAQSQASYYDGYRVPLLIGTGEGECRLEMRAPRYSITETEICIQV
ncbi:MAG: hypothetical protein WBO10_14360 [Pyrinomonadaceae bacterium]